MVESKMGGAVKQDPKGFLSWYRELRQLARQNELQWLLSSSPAHHQTSYEKGFSPDEELAELEELAQWQGCGCGA